MSRRVLLQSGQFRKPSKLAIPSLESRDVTDSVVSEPRRLAELLQKLVIVATALMGSRQSDFIDYEDFPVTGTTGSPEKYRFPHQFGARVRWYPVDWAPDPKVALATGPILRRHEDTTANVLVLESMASGTLTLRVEVMPSPSKLSRRAGTFTVAPRILRRSRGPELPLAPRAHPHRCRAPHAFSSCKPRSPPRTRGRRPALRRGARRAARPFRLARVHAKVALPTTDSRRA